MNAIVATVLLNTMKLITSGDLMEHVVQLVSEVASMEIAGEDKRRAVLQRLKAIGGDLQPVIAATAGYLLNLAVEVAVAYLKSRSES